MRASWKNAVALAACCAVLGAVSVASAADVRPGEKVKVETSFRASKLMGMHVRNAENENLGKIEDFVIDVGNGHIAYVAMGVGGLLGVGEKLFAVPFSQLKFTHGKDDTYFVLNMSKDKLKAAPGFDKNDWPDFADPAWSRHIDDYYRRTETTVNKKVTTN